MSKVIPPKVFTPIADYIAVSILQGPDETEGGVLIPENAKHNWTTPVAVVVACGPACVWVKEGDHVLVHPSTRADKAIYKRHSYLLLRERRVAGILLEKVACALS